MNINFKFINYPKDPSKATRSCLLAIGEGGKSSPRLCFYSYFKNKNKKRGGGAHPPLSKAATPLKETGKAGQLLVLRDYIFVALVTV